MRHPARSFLPAVALVALADAGAAQERLPELSVVGEGDAAGFFCPVDRLEEIFISDLPPDMVDDANVLLAIRSHVGRVCLQQQNLLQRVWDGDRQLRETFGLSADAAPETPVETERAEDDADRIPILATLLSAIAANAPSPDAAAGGLAESSENAQSGRTDQEIVALDPTADAEGETGTDTPAVDLTSLFGSGEGEEGDASPAAPVSTETATATAAVAADEPAVEDPETVAPRPATIDESEWATVTAMRMLASVRGPAGGWTVSVATVDADGAPVVRSMQPGDEIDGWMLVEAAAREARLRHRDGREALLRAAGTTREEIVR